MAISQPHPAPIGGHPWATLVYLGFLRAEEMHDQGLPLADAESWDRLVREQSSGIVPATAWDRAISIGGTPFRAVVRSMELPLDSAS
jgi:hypothetical protein